MVQENQEAPGDELRVVVWQRLRGSQSPTRLFLDHDGRFMHVTHWIQSVYWGTSLQRVKTKHFQRRVKGRGSVAHPFRINLQRISVFPLFFDFESWKCDISFGITELIKRLLKLYEILLKGIESERLNWLLQQFDTNLNPLPSNHP